MTTEITTVVHQCDICGENFWDWESCYYHEEECKHKQDSTPKSSMVIIRDGIVYLWTLSRVLYKQNGDHLECAGGAGIGGVPPELEFLFNMQYDEKLGKWTEDEIPF